MPDLEIRYTHRKVEVRNDENDKPKIVGYGAVFGSRSEDLGGFTEIIEPGAFDDAMEDDTRALFNHNDDIILGRRSSGTLELTLDDTGLRYEIDPPDSQLVRDMVLIPMQRGDISHSSFGFFLKKDGDTWEEDRNGKVTRTILKGGIERLLDVSPVTFPAYPDTEVALRKLNLFTDKSSKFAKELDDKDMNITELMIRCMKQMHESSAPINKEYEQVMQRAIDLITSLNIDIDRKARAMETYRRLIEL